MFDRTSLPRLARISLLLTVPLACTEDDHLVDADGVEVSPDDEAEADDDTTRPALDLTAPQKGATPAAEPLEEHLSFDIDLPAAWPARVASVTLYKTVRGAPPADLAAMQAAFGVEGRADRSPDFGGVVHVRDGQKHVYVHDSGALAFHDTGRIGLMTPIRPQSDRALIADAARRLTALNIDAPGMPDLMPGRVTAARAVTDIRDTRPTADWLVAQTVSFEQRIDGLPTFGGGNDVQLVYGNRGELVSFTSQVRPLQPAGDLTIDSAEEAVDRYLDRANITGRWNMVRSHVTGVQRLSIDHVQLGYYTPSLAAPADELEPVYAIGGSAHGVDHTGARVTVPVLWFEPAARGRSIAELAVSSAE